MTQKAPEKTRTTSSRINYQKDFPSCAFSKMINFGQYLTVNKTIKCYYQTSN